MMSNLWCPDLILHLVRSNGSRWNLYLSQKLHSNDSNETAVFFARELAVRGSHRFVSGTPAVFFLYFLYLD